MGLLLSIIFGAVVGWIASMIMGAGRGEVLWDIVLGILGSVVGSFIMSAIGQPGVSGFDLYSFAVAVIGAIILIYLGRMFRRGGV